jgi:DNA sulfur modification protein DndC
MEVRVEILRRLLAAQQEIQQREHIVLLTHQEMILIQYHWFRDCYFKTKVSDVYNSIFKTKIDMSKQEEKVKQETELLLKSLTRKKKMLL